MMLVARSGIASLFREDTTQRQTAQILLYQRDTPRRLEAQILIYREGLKEGKQNSVD